jgi:hypothetical protein
MNRFKVTGAAALAVALMSVPSIAQDTTTDQNRRPEATQQPSDSARPDASGDAESALKNVARKMKQEAEAQGDRKIQVAERAVWGLGELPPKLMSKACELIATDADKAKLSVMQAANILELTASIGKDTGESRELMEQAKQLRDVAGKIETRQILTQDQLKQPFARAALAAAKYYEAAARNGLEKNDEEQTGYTLMGAAGYLTAAHVFADKEPTAEVSRAAYDANVTAQQIVRLSKETTVQPQGMQTADARGADNQGQASTNTDQPADAQASPDSNTQRQMERQGEGRVQPGIGSASGTSNTGSSSSDSAQDQANIPQATRQVLDNLKQAISSINLPAEKTGND